MTNTIAGIYARILGTIAELTLRLSCSIRNHALRVSFRPTTSSLEDQMSAANDHVGRFEKIALHHVVAATEVDRLLILPDDSDRQRGITGLVSRDSANHYWNTQDKLISVREKLLQVRASARLAISVANRLGWNETMEIDPAELKAAHCFVDLVTYRSALCKEDTERDSLKAYRVLAELGVFTFTEIDQLSERSGYTLPSMEAKEKGSCHVS